MKVCFTGDLAESLREEARGIIANAVSDSAREAELIVLGPYGSFDGDARGLEVLYFSLSATNHPAAMKALLGLFDSPSLRWVQGPGAGIDHPIWQGLIDRGVRLTNASGIHSEPIAQYIFAYVLHWERNVRQHQEQQARREWKIIHSEDLAQKTLGIVGYGGIGQAAARIARAFGMRVLATRRTPVEDDVLDRFVPLADLHELLAESDYVVLCMPFNDDTREMLGAAEFAAMGASSVLINVARGGVVNESDLIEALSARMIRGATLDVVSEEPLPESSPLWGLDNCMITPHDAGYSPLGDTRLGALFLENLRRYAAGDTLINEISTTGFGDR